MPRKKDDYEEDSFLNEEIDDGEDECDDSADEQASEGNEEDKGDSENKPAKPKRRKKGQPSTPVSEESAESDEVAEETEEETEEVTEEVVEEEEIDYPPDDEKALAALTKLRVRLDVSPKGNVWRAFFDDCNGKDQALVLLNGLPALKELWLLGTKVTADTAQQFKEDHPKITVYY